MEQHRRHFDAREVVSLVAAGAILIAATVASVSRSDQGRVTAAREVRTETTTSAPTTTSSTSTTTSTTPATTAAPTTTTQPTTVPTTALGLGALDETGEPALATSNPDELPPIPPVRPPAPWPAGCCATLTGLGYDDASYAGRPPLAVKIDNSKYVYTTTRPVPHTGLNLADLIYELRVEGISRFIAVFHSRSTEVVGPVRSARTSDPNVLAGLGKPLVSYSGGNQTVYNVMYGAPWLVNVNYSRVHSAYFRKGCCLPDNFFGDTRVMRQAGDALGRPPTPPYQFLADGESNPGAVRGTAIDLDVGRVHSRFEWSPDYGRYLRWQYGRAHTDVVGEQVARTSVVVLAMSYGVSGADNRSPEAISVGSGEAWVFTGGTYVHGSWFRPDPTSGWNLTSDSGQPIKLARGPVWITLTDVRPAFS